MNYETMQYVLVGLLVIAMVLTFLDRPETDGTPK